MVGRKARCLSVFGRLGSAIILLAALVTCEIFAQGSTATIIGVVRDTSGALIPGVTINVKHLDSGLTRTVLSSETGNYTVQSLPVGPYEITTNMPGFKQEVRRGIDLVVGQEAVIDLTLEVGANAEQVTVSEEAPLVNTTLALTSGLISEQQVKDLPLNGRSFDNLLLLNVNTTNPSGNVNNGAWNAFSVAGKRMEANRYLLNGLDWIGQNGTGQFITPMGTSRQLLGVDAVREFNVLPHSYGAEYGKRSGGQISVVTSSGTNQLHGTVFEYLRNSALDARNFFDQSANGAPPFKRNQFGASLGGPLIKDKAFLFGNYEGFQQRWVNSAATAVPDANARQGMLPCYMATPTACGSSPNQFVTVPNLKRGMLPYLQYFWPTPTQEIYDTQGRPTGTALSFLNAPSRVKENFGMARFDYTLSSKDSFWANYNYDDGNDGRPPADPTFVTVDHNRTMGLGVQETHIFSPSLLNTFTYGFAKVFAISQSLPAAASPIPANLSFITGDTAGSITVGGSAQTNTPGSVVAPNGNMPYRGRRFTNTWSDDVHFTRGNHSWSAGVWIYKLEEDLFGGAQTTAGTIAYGSILTMLQDIPTAFQVTPRSNPGDFTSTESAWYVQDEWKVKPRLSLRLGLRDEMTNGWNAPNGQCSNYIFGPDGVIKTDPVLAHSCLLQNNAKALLQPRIGLAWDPTGNGKWAVRAAFGIHNDLQDNLGHRIQANPPYNMRVSLPTASGLLAQIPIDPNLPIPPSCHNAPTEKGCSIFSPGGIDPTLHTPTIQNWSLTVERGLTQNLMLSVGYVGMESYHTTLAMDTNMSVPQVCASAAGCLSGGVGTARATVPQGTVYLPVGPRPNQNIANTLSWIYNGTSSYNAMNVSLTKRSQGGLTFKTNYTWSKVLDLNSAILNTYATNEPSTVLDPFDLKRQRGPASYDLTHQFNANFSYPLPFGRGQHFAGNAGGLMDKLIGGWQWNGVMNLQSGFPFTPQAGSNISGTGDASGTPDVPNLNPNFHGPVVLGVDAFKKSGRYFDPNAFVLPLPGTFGNVSRGMFRGPGLFSLDTSLFKRFAINEKVNLQFRAEAFNVTNHTNFSSPNPAVFSGSGYSPAAGILTQTNGYSRQIQFALKVMF
jgi:Carboxypeptidase regulatory-like domain